ncbi:MAG: hypothetical protein KUG77_17395 [Nannocystaceae bacterium]|nr:hypothetical protein [Nannocystaceae bacterium]
MTARSEPGSRRLNVAIVWLVLVLGMMLHFNYEVSGLRYAVSMEQPGASGVVPWSNFWIKSIFYVLPMLMAVSCTLEPGRLGRTGHLAMSVLFALANGMHFTTTLLAASNVLAYAQVVLLAAVLIANIQLIRLIFRWRYAPA